MDPYNNPHHHPPPPHQERHFPHLSHHSPPPAAAAAPPPGSYPHSSPPASAVDPHGHGHPPLHDPAYGHGYPSDIQLPRGQLVKVFPKADKNFALAVRDGGVVVVLADNEDESQLWVKDESYGTRSKDNFGFPAFALVNKAYGKVLKHPREKGQQVLLGDYRLGMIGDDILWTESQDFGEGFATIRVASDTLLNVTILHAEKKGGLKNGAPVILDTWHKHDGQLWKIFPL